MRNFEESVSVLRKASVKMGALLCLAAVGIFTLPVGAQRVTSQDERAKRSAGITESVQMSPQAPQADLLMYAYNVLPPSIVIFNAESPGTIIDEIFLTGLDDPNEESLVFIDFRPVNGVLYAVAKKDIPTPVSRVVTIDLTTGAVTSVGGTIPTSANDLFFGGDFNSVVDRIREVNSSNGNRRLNPNDGTVVANDTPLAYAPGDPNFGTPPRITHIAYSNNFPGATNTTLYGIDVTQDTLVRIGSPGGDPNSPDSGLVFTIGPLNAVDSDGEPGNVQNFGGFDIHAGTGLAYAALLLPQTAERASTSFLYSIDLSTGEATLIGEIGADSTYAIDGLAIALSGGSADLSISKSDTTTTYLPGMTRTYTVVAGNSGPDPVVNATVTDNFSAQFSSVSWTCSGSGGGTCPASGTGNISASVNIPVGGTVTFIIQATVSQSASGDLVNTATVTPPEGVTDSNLANNTATDVNTLLTTSAGVMVSGRVMAPDGRGLRGARVTMVDPEGISISVATSSLGYFTFEDVDSGNTYVIGVASRRYRFDSRVIQVSDNLTDVNFIGLE